MSYYLGIDLGTSAVKVMLADGNGSTLAMSSVGYPSCILDLGGASGIRSCGGARRGAPWARYSAAAMRS